MRKILIFDPSIGTTNLGDEIIANSAYFYLNKLFSNDFIIRLPSRMPLMRSYQKSKKYSLYRNIINSDLKIICGTNLLYTNMLRPWPLLNINIFDTKLYKNIILMGVGCGINSKNINMYTKYIYEKTLHHDFIHSVRDDFTKNFLETLGFKVINTGCPTLWKLDNEFCKLIPRNKSENVIFTITDYAKDHVNDKLLINILKRNYKKIYFWPQGIEDLKYLKSLEIDSSIIILPPNLKEFEKYLNSTETDYIGTRLHAGIFALQHKVRSIILSVDYRAKNMSNQFALPIFERKEYVAKLEDLIYQEINIHNICKKENYIKWLAQFQ